MARLEEIVERVDRRLEELHEESTRLRAALQALGRDDPPANRRLHANQTARRAVLTLDCDDPVKPTSDSAVTLMDPHTVNGHDAAQDPHVQRAIRRLRQELAAGLRG